MSEHRVESHLRVAAAAYDVAIRTFVPHYEEMISTAVELLRLTLPRTATIVDLGGGTGGLTDALLHGLPEARVEMVDIDPEMLEEAAVRFGTMKARVVLRKGDFFDPLPECDAVVASLSLHHVRDLRDKTRLYASIQKALRPGGMFLNLDATMSSDPVLKALTFDTWAKEMARYGIDDAGARRHFADWAKEDHYVPLHAELRALAEAGFREPECFWRRGPTTVYGARKP